ncbi:MAG TPA: TIGR00730 family Rossman fold protein [Caulobacteraceae bacterium]|nr:TIGR00730 family Rossman fold protein [Caulobacteraceae bacterium]
MPAPPPIKSVCVYCGSSDAVDPALLDAAAEVGRTLAREGLRLVYGGGRVGLMGACAKAAHAAGGRILGVMPEFLRQHEILYDVVEVKVVRSMHERKMAMFEAADAFVVLPGGIGTLEEVIELMSWRRLDLHRKPIVFFNPDGFWNHLFAFFRQTVEMKLAPEALASTWAEVDAVDELLPAIHGMAAIEIEPIPRLMPPVT